MQGRLREETIRTAGIPRVAGLARSTGRVLPLLTVWLVAGCGQDERAAEPGRTLDASELIHTTEPPADPLTRGLAALQRGDTDVAVRDLLDVTAADSMNAVAFDGLASAYGMMGDASSALAAAERAVRLDGENPAYLSNRAQAYRRFGRDDDALRDLSRAVELQPDFVAALFNRGSLRYQREDYAGALEDFAAAIEADPSAAPPYFNRAVTLEALGDLDAARRDLEHFIEISESESARSMAAALLEQWGERFRGS